MPFCPICRAEYVSEVSFCPVCNEPLVAELDEAGTDDPMVDVYACYDVQLADRVMSLLREGGIESSRRSLSSSAFPTNIGTNNEFRIAVAADLAARAARLISDATDDGVIAANLGELL